MTIQWAVTFKPLLSPQNMSSDVWGYDSQLLRSQLFPSPSIARLHFFRVFVPLRLRSKQIQYPYKMSITLWWNVDELLVTISSVLCFSWVLDDWGRIQWVAHFLVQGSFAVFFVLRIAAHLAGSQEPLGFFDSTTCLNDRLRFDSLFMLEPWQRCWISGV